MMQVTEQTEQKRGREFQNLGPATQKAQSHSTVLALLMTKGRQWGNSVNITKGISINSKGRCSGRI